jgi:uncharacterized protein (TIGR02266 family)
LIALVDVEFVDLDLGITFGAARHTSPRLGAIRLLGVWQLRTGRARIRSAGDRDKRSDYSDTLRESAMHANASIAAKTVVIADDTAFVRDRFRAAVEAAGHRAIAVKSAAELLARVRSDHKEIDLIVLDLRLPQSPGVELVRALRQLDERAPLLIFSGTIASADEVRQLASLGVAGYVNEYSAVQHIVPSLAPHLFPDNFNRRSSPRVVLGIPVQYRFNNTIAAALTLNLSRGGIAIRTTSPLESGSRIRVRFRMPGSKRDVEAEGRVAWSDRRVGMGVQFEQVDPATQVVIDNFVDAHFFSNRKA